MSEGRSSLATLALTLNGTVYAWGQNTSGQLGDGTNQNRSLPVPVAGLSGVATLQAGVYSSFVIQSDGKVRAWGANWYGQLGDRTRSDRWSPVSLDLPKPVTGLDSSYSHTVALFTDGTMAILNSLRDRSSVVPFGSLTNSSFKIGLSG
ncbi:MAG: hypothetical protein EBU49_12520 [Proteobacteria bacterium]|nr:hypothetical protein [Pseudomonadota bacterium]